MTKLRSLKDPDTLQFKMQPVETIAWTVDSAEVCSQQEHRRLQHLRQFDILDTPKEALFEFFVKQALKIVPGASIAAVSLVDADRQWFKAIVGLDATQTCRSQSFCAHTVQTNGVLVVNDASKDARFSGNELVTGDPGIRFYAGIKLTRAVGALCVIGTEPRSLTDTEVSKLMQLSQFVDIQLLTRAAPHNLRGKP